MSGKLGQILLRLGYVTEADLERVLDIQRAEGGKRKVGEILTELFVKEDVLLQALSLQTTATSGNSGLDLVSSILAKRLSTDEIKDMLGALKAQSKEELLDLMVAILEKIASFIDLFNRMSNIISLDTLLDNMIATITELVDADRATLFLNDRDTNELFSRILKGSEVSEIRFPNHLGIAGSVFTTGNRVIIDDAYADPRFNQEVDRKTGYRTRNILCAPIRTRQGEIVGVIQVLNKKEGGFTIDDLTLLEAVTSQVSAALQNAQLFEQVERAREEETRLLEVTTAISTELQLLPLLAKIMQTTIDILDADRSTLFMYEPKTKELWSQVAQGAEVREIRFPAHLGIAGSVFTSGLTVNIPDAYADPRFNQEVDKRTGYRTQSILCMPVINKEGRTIGVMQVLNKRGGPFTTMDEKRLRAFSAQGSIAIENAKLFDEVLEMKNYMEGMLESMSNGVLSLDSSHQIVKSNSAAQRILRTSAQALAGRDTIEFFSGENRWIIESVRRVTQTSQPDTTLDTDIVIADGSQVSINLTVAPLLTAKGKILGTMLVIEDISREKRLKGTMARYMAKEVAEKLLEEGEDALGGQLQEATVFFSDIRSFTTLAERTGATETVSLLNEYFTVMVDILMTYNGILDKYIGDAIMAVFGAPFTGPEDADNAVRTAVEMMSALGKFNAKRRELGLFPIEIGIGINTDNVLSGNIGSLKRMDYTVIGDGVNLASRLEGANKLYGTHVLISEFTARKLVRTYKMREVDLVKVKGKVKPVGIYEVLDYYDASEFPALDEVIGLFKQGVERYRAKDWPRAIECFEQALKLQPTDSPSKLYITRCQEFLQTPPPDDWDGVYTMKSK